MHQPDEQISYGKKLKINELKCEIIGKVLVGTSLISRTDFSQFQINKLESSLKTLQNEKNI